MQELSIIVPIYNSQETLKRCLLSIKKSTYRNHELIVIDDGSSDRSPSIASQYADIVLTNKTNRGKVYSRDIGIKRSKGRIVVNIDSDVIVRHDTLETINKYFNDHPEVDAITGMLSEENPYKNFLSQYKTLYMSFMFSNLSEDVTFLYGSIFALRKKMSNKLSSSHSSNYAEDTSMGQRIISIGGHISFLKELKVVHLKHYSLMGFIKNEFIIPYYWAILFLSDNGWSQLGKGGVGFAHASKKQIVSLIVSGLLLISLFLQFLLPWVISVVTVLIATWFYLNWNFLFYLKNKRGASFFLLSIPTTFFDDLIKLTGVIIGTLSFFTKKLYRFNIK